MKELTFSIQNKQEQELSIVMQGHKVPITIVVGTSHMDLEMEDVDDLIKVLHMMKSQHKTFVNVEPMGVQDLKKDECSPSHQTNVYANLPTPPKVENKKEIQLQVGQRYKARRGDIWSVVGKNGNGTFDCESELGLEGRFYGNGRYFSKDEHEHDLIELISPQPDKDEHGRWILNEGDTVMLSNSVEGVVIEKDESDLPYKIQFPFEDDTDYEWFYGTAQDKKAGPYITSIIKRAK